MSHRSMLACSTTLVTARSGLGKAGWENYLYACTRMIFCLKESGEFLPGMAADMNLQTYGNNLYNCPKELWLRVTGI